MQFLYIQSKFLRYMKILTLRKTMLDITRTTPRRGINFTAITYIDYMSLSFRIELDDI